MVNVGDKVRITSADPEDADWLTEHIGEVYTVTGVVTDADSYLKAGFADLDAPHDELRDSVYLHDLTLVYADPPMLYRVRGKSPSMILGEFRLEDDAQLFVSALKSAYPHLYSDLAVENI